MLEYIHNIIIPYVESECKLLEDEEPAVVITNNFKGQVIPAVNDLLDKNYIHVYLLPPNTTDCLQLTYGHLSE